jgi:type II secretory pathway component PulF
MIRFHYIAVDAQGHELRGAIDAPDWTAACEALKETGLTDPRRAAEDILITSPPRLSASEAVDLTGYLAALARTGLPLAPGLRAMAGEVSGSRLNQALTTLAARLESGHSLPAALATLESSLPAHHREVLLASASSGQLSATLDDLLAEERLVDDLGRRLWQAVLYPTVLLTLLTAWILFVAMWLIPQMDIASILSDVDDLSQLSWNAAPNDPPVDRGTRLTEFSRVAPIVVLGSLAAGLLVLLVAGAIGGRALISRLLGQVPLVGTAWRYRSLVEFSGLLAALVRRQLSLPEALRLTALSERDPAFCQAATAAAARTAEGASLEACLKHDALFPPTFRNLVAWGEAHHALVEALDGARQMYLERFELQLRLVRLVVPPLVFLLVAASVLLVAYGWISSVTSAIRMLSSI